MRILSGSAAATRGEKNEPPGDRNTRKLNRQCGVSSRMFESTATARYGSMPNDGMDFRSKNRCGYLKTRLKQHGNPLPPSYEIRCAPPPRIFAASANGKSQQSGCVRGRGSASGKS